MKWKELEGMRLVGIMNNKSDELLFFVKDKRKKRILFADSENQNYSWFDNWKLVGDYTGEVKLNDSYKQIGSKIEEVTHVGEEKEDGRVFAIMDEWIKAVGEGSWGATEGKSYFFITIKTPLKTVRLGTVYWDCHYPSTIWDII